MLNKVFKTLILCPTFGPMISIIVSKHIALLCCIELSRPWFSALYVIRCRQLCRTHISSCYVALLSRTWSYALSLKTEIRHDVITNVIRTWVLLRITQPRTSQEFRGCRGGQVRSKASAVTERKEITSVGWDLGTSDWALLLTPWLKFTTICQVNANSVEDCYT